MTDYVEIKFKKEDYELLKKIADSNGNPSVKNLLNECFNYYFVSVLRDKFISDKENDVRNKLKKQFEELLVIDKIKDKELQDQKILDFFYKYSSIREDLICKEFINFYWWETTLSTAQVPSYLNLSLKELNTYRDKKVVVPVICYDCKINEFEYTINSRHDKKKYLNAYNNKKPIYQMHRCENCKKKEEQKQNAKKLKKDEKNNKIQAERESGLLQTMSYKDYLKTEHWKTTRYKRIKLDKATCQHCGKVDWKNHVHHLTYVNRGNEKIDDLMTLCGNCHKKIHENEEFISS